MGREREAIELLAEVLDHVVAFGFAVHQYVDAQFFLLANGQGDGRAHLRAVAADIQVAAFENPPRPARATRRAPSARFTRGLARRAASAARAARSSACTDAAPVSRAARSTRSSSSF